jgi:hypothetical protein
MYLEEYQKLSTFGDWIDYLNRDHENFYEMTREVSSHYWPEANGYDYLGNIAGIPEFNDLLTKLTYTEVLEKDDKHKDSSEAKLDISHGYKLGFDKLNHVQGLEQITDLLGMENCDVTIHVQQPSQICKLHMDNITSYFHHVTDVADEFSTQEFDHKMRQPKGSKPLYRLFVALDDWHPGQSWLWGETPWIGYKKGDVVNFQWRAVPHGTCNFGWHIRPMLRLTGFLQDESIVTRTNQQWSIDL